MAILDQLFGAGIGGLGDFVAKVVGTFKMSPAAALEFQQKLAENEFALKKMEADLEARLSDTAAANIQAEEKSGDKYVARARPTFLYIVEFILLWNYVVVPLFRQVPVQLPDALFWLFGSCVLGYTGARTWEKFAGKETK